MPDRRIRLVLADVDGTLVTSDKEITDHAVAAVESLREAGIEFAVTSGRPPRGMSMLVEPFALKLPIAAFNGGVMANPDLSVISEKDLSAPVVDPIASLMGDHELDVWMYTGSDWFVRDENGAHVTREASTVQFGPTVVSSYDEITDPIVKIVGVSDDHDAVASAESAVRGEFGWEVSATRSQPYYLDVTHPEANKGSVVRFLSRELDIPLENVASIGDMPNDVLMFAHCGIGIAMGNADREVQRAARFVTTSNDEEGFARAMEQFVLPD
jgi:Cof subfamily protein (haloacid dehalogenase superfamily)